MRQRRAPAHEVIARGGHQVRTTRQHARAHIAVTAEILADAMHHEVGAVRERPYEDGRGKRRVDHEDRPGRMRRTRQRRQVGDVHERVGQRLDVEDLRSLTCQRGGHGLGVLLVDVRDAHAGFTVIVLK